MGIIDKTKDFIATAYTKVKGAVDYCMTGVWNDPRQTIKIRIIRTLNLAVNSFMDRNLQNRSMALTYSTVLVRDLPIPSPELIKQTLMKIR